MNRTKRKRTISMQARYCSEGISTATLLLASIVGLACPYANSNLGAQGSSDSVETMAELSAAADAANEIDPQSANRTLVERQRTIHKLLPKLEAATVCLQAEGGSGSGVIVSEDGLILTAAHVVQGQQEMTVRFMDGRKLRGKVLGFYNPADAAMVKMIDEGPYEYVEVAPKGTLQLAQTVLAIGHPGGYDEQRGIPLRIGHIVSFDDRGFYSSDAALIGGDSGGPSFNMLGQVIGIHSNISGAMSANHDIKIDAFHQNWDSMAVGKTTGDSRQMERIAFGAKVMSSVEGAPVHVAEVVADTPADWSGLEIDDLIVAVDGQPVGGSHEFMRALLLEEFGRDFKLQVKRGGKDVTLDVKLMPRNKMKARRKQRDGESVEPAPAPEAGKDNASIDYPSASDRNSRQWVRCATEPISLAQERQSEKRNEQYQEKEAEPQTELQQLLEESRASNGRLKIKRDQLREYRDKLAKRIDQLAPVGGRQWDDWGKQFQAAFSEPTAKLSQSSFPLHVSGRQVALATLVDRRGYFVSKASELEGRKATIHLNADRQIEAMLVEVDRELDIALLRIDFNAIPSFKNCPSIDFSQHASAPLSEPDKGVLCCAIGNHPKNPSGFGVVSVAARALNGNTSAYLGVDATDAEDAGGARMSKVAAESPADLAGLKNGDIIESIDAQSITSAADLVKAVESRLPNENVKLTLRRGANWLTLPVKLGDKSKVAQMPGSREQGTDGLSTSMNRRRWNFAAGIQHDCSIEPKHCGGVLVNLQGGIIGLNIARAGRIRSYAIPTELVAKFVTLSIESDQSTEVTALDLSTAASESEEAK